MYRDKNRGKTTRRRTWFVKKYFLLLTTLMLILSPFSSMGGMAYAESEGQADVDAEESGEEIELDKSELDESNELGSEQIEYGEGFGEDDADSSAKNPDTDLSSDNDLEIEFEELTEETEIKQQGASSEDTIETVENEELMGTSAGVFSQAQSFPEDYTVSDNADGSVTITGYSGTERDLIIPSELDGKPVTKIGQSAFSNKELTSVVIPDGVISIAYYAFVNNNLKSIHISKTVEDINETNPFYNNPLQTITVDAENQKFIDIDEKGLYTKNKEELLAGTVSGHIAAGTKKIANSAFSVVKIEGGTVTIPDSVEVIDQFAFDTSNLHEVNLSNNLEEIGSGAFRNNNITEVNIPESVTTIGNQAFLNNNLTEITIPKNVMSISQQAFQNNELINVTLPENVTTIGNRAFLQNKLTSIDLPDSIEKIDYQAFHQNNLESVVLPENLKTIGQSAFSQNYITSVIIPDKVVTIGDFAFSSNLLQRVTLPKSVESLGMSAFASNNLTNVEIFNKDTTIGENTFGQNQAEPEFLTIIGHNPSTAKTYADDNGHTFGQLPDPSEYQFTDNGDGTVTITEYNGKDKNITIPHEIDSKTVTIIGDTIFNSKELTSVVIPDSVTSIGKSAFNDNKLTTIIIPESVEDIGELAFSNNKLTSVTIFNRQVTIGENAFEDNQGDSEDLTIKGYDESTAKDYAEEYQYTFESLPEFEMIYEWKENADETITITKYTGRDRDVTIPSQIKGKDVTVIGERVFNEKKLTNVTIPETVKVIEEYAFSSNNLTTITIPDSVSVIKEGSFYDNNLSSVTIPKSVIELNNNPFSNNPLKTIIVDKENSNLIDIDNKALYTKDGKELIIGTDSGYIAEGTVTIGNYAFSNFNLTEITLPHSVETIGEGAFTYNRLTKMTIPKSVNNIDEYAFYSNHLREVIFKNSLVDIKLSAFYFNVEAFTIYGYVGSTAEQLAELYQVPFVPFYDVDDIEELADYSVDYGTELNHLPLPDEIEVTLDDETTRMIKVNWNNGNPTYDGIKPGSYEFTGELNLAQAQDIFNPKNLTVTVTVTVNKEPDQPGDPGDEGDSDETPLPDIVTPTPDNEVIVDGQPVPVQPGQLIHVTDADGNVVLALQIPSTVNPANALDDATLEISSVSNLVATGLSTAGEVLDITFRDASGNVIHVTGDFVLSLLVHDSADNIAIYHEIGPDEWERIGGSVEGNFITAIVNNFSKYGVFYADATDPTTDPSTDSDPDTTVTVDESTVETDSQLVTGKGGPGKLLPSTATSWFNIIALGAILLFIGTITILLTRRKRSA